MAGKRKLTVEIAGDVKGLSSSLDDADKRFAGFGSKVAGASKAIAIGVAGAATALGAFAVSAVGKASDLSESMSKVSVVFGDQAAAIDKWASKSATAFGQSKQQALEAAGTYGNLFQAFGIGRKEASSMSTSLVELAADLASFNNTSIEEALQSLQSGLSGETEPLKKYGIAINDDRLKTEALRLGLIKTTKEALTPAAKAQASYALILKDTTLAQGDFARTSDGLANKQRILKARFSDIQAEIGTKLLPVATKLAGILADRVLPAIEKLWPQVQILASQIGEKLAPVFQAAFAWIGENVPPILDAIAKFVREDVVPALQNLATWAQDNLLPALERLAASFQEHIWPILRDKVIPVLQETARIIVEYILPAVGKLVVFVVGDLIPTLFAIIDVVVQVIGKIADFGMKVANVAGDIGATVAGITLTFWHFLGEVRETVGRVVDVFAGIAQAISAPFRSAFNFIADAWNNTVGKLSFEIPGWVPGLGGKGWDVPDLPHFHTGSSFAGMLAAPTGGLAMLRPGEQVSLPGSAGPGVTVIVQGSVISAERDLVSIIESARRRGVTV